MLILIVEDSADLSVELAEGLKAQGFHSEIVDTGRDALERYADADAVLLDIGLPDMDGFEVCRKIRTTSSIPVIVQSARSDEFDKVLALKLGADDYINKPCGLRELAARIEAVIRRVRNDWDTGPVGSIEHRRTKCDVRELNDVRIDIDRRRVTVKEHEICLTRKEFDFLAVLAREPGKVISREDIMTEVWGHDGYGDTRTLGVHLTSLRKKLGVPELIETVRGVGFRLAF